MKYESNILKRLIDTYGVVGNPRYISEIIKEFIVQGKERFPDLFTYQSDWLAHIDEFGLNPSYTVSYTGQSIYAPNTLEKPVKSAILKGQTLVNCLDLSLVTVANNATKIGDTITIDNTTQYSRFNVFNNQPLMPFDTNTKYIMFLHDVKGDVSGLVLDCFGKNYNLINNKYFIFNLNAVDSTNRILWVQRNTNPTTTTDTVSFKVSIFKYQQGMENWDIPFFEGMQSVKMPVLKTTGKNLFGGSLITTNDGRRFELKGFELIEGEKYALSYNCSKDGAKTHQLQYMTNSTSNPTYLSAVTTSTSECKLYFTVPKDLARLFIYTNDWSSNLEHFSNIQIEQGTQETPYEPYKSNILSCNEEVTLRGIGDVKDTLNCLTGELTQRTGKFMVDGTEDFGWYGDCGESLYGFNIYKSSIVEKLNNEVDDNRPSLCSTLEYRGTTMYGKTGTGFAISRGSDSAFLQIVIQKEKLSDTTLDGIKQYLSENPLYFVVPLLDKSIKTVDLNILDQNGQNIKQLMSFNGGTHFITGSAEGSLLPVVSVSVETDLEETLRVCSLEGNTL